MFLYVCLCLYVICMFIHTCIQGYGIHREAVGVKLVLDSVKVRLEQRL